jgi:hypothetical protein
MDVYVVFYQTTRKTEMKRYLYGVLLAVFTMTQAHATLIDASVGPSISTPSGTITIEGFDTSLGTLNSVHYEISMIADFNTAWANQDPNQDPTNAEWLAIVSANFAFTAPAPIGVINEVLSATTNGFVIAYAPQSHFPSLAVFAFRDDFLTGSAVFERDWEFNFSLGPLTIEIIQGNYDTQGSRTCGPRAPIRCAVTAQHLFTNLIGMDFDVRSVVYDYTPAAIVEVPEPSTLAIFVLGMIGLASRRFKKQS